MEGPELYAYALVVCRDERTGKFLLIQECVCIYDEKMTSISHDDISCMLPASDTAPAGGGSRGAASTLVGGQM